VKAIMAQAGITAEDITYFLHGTTVATNAVLEGKGARVGLVTTQGYRDIMQIARSFVPGGLAAWIVWPKPQPLARLEHTVEVPGRMDAQGREVAPLDEDAVRAALRKLKGDGIEALTVSLMNAYLNGAHEARIGEIAAEELPGIPVSLSHEVLPEMQEYERTLSTVANAAVRPVVSKYVSNLRDRLAIEGFKGRLSLLRSDGGLMSSQKAEEHPVNILMSGPAGGVTGALWVAKNAGFENILTLDVGGTSTDVALIQGLEPRRQLQHRRHARGVVVGPVEDLAVIDADMVVVGRHHDIAVGDARSGDQADDVDHDLGSVFDQDCPGQEGGASQGE
jgi:N-methylhydantoinase A